ncbi:hypothetical protein MBLNU459_g5207t1 [Dothideomycetes sp. NU459]
MAATRMTPGRRRHNNTKENVYFEPGKQGRRTGITLKDTGLRDEHGLEPVSGIFSSPPASPDRATQNGSRPDITETLILRQTPHLPPRSPGLRHTNIGGSPLRPSPVRPDSRHSSPTRPLSAQPSSRANRLLDFSKPEAEPSKPTYDQSPSPFKPRPAKSARLQKTRKSLFDFGEESPARNVDFVADDGELEKAAQDVVDSLVTESATDAFAHGANYAASTGPSHDDDQDADATDAVTEFVTDAATDDLTDADVADATESAAIIQPSDHPSSRKTPRSRNIVGPNRSALEVDANGSPALTASSSNQKRKRGRPRASDPSTVAASEPSDLVVAIDQPTPARKRLRSSLDESSIIDTTETSLPDGTAHDATQVAPASASAKTRKSFVVQRDDNELPEVDDEEMQSNASFEDFQPPPEDDIQELEIEQVQQTSKKSNRPRQTKKSKPENQQPKRRSAHSDRASQNRAGRDVERQVRDIESVDPEGKKRGPKSLVQLRAGTPMEDDDGATRTRSGRTSIKPLKYWQNETYVWDHGEINAVVRASEIEQPKKQVNRSTNRRKTRAPGSRLSAIEEDVEDEDEELLPEGWESELGVISTEVKYWNSGIGAPHAHETVDEEVAFAPHAIVTRDVQNSAFRYAKIMTLPFFGSGMVEIPPSGFKRTKNSRKMQMIFFVHEGKVTVEVAGVKFGMTKGGVWQVPRGNNYAIYNESTRHSAMVFFAQGCESDGPSSGPATGNSAVPVTVAAAVAAGRDHASSA